MLAVNSLHLFQPACTRRSVCVAILFLLLPKAAFAETPDASCQRLAGPAIKIEQINPETAVAACAAAVTASPASAELTFAFGRSLQRAGRIADARNLYKWSSDLGSPDAAAALSDIAVREEIDQKDSADRKKFASSLENLASLSERVVNTVNRGHFDSIEVLAESGLAVEPIVGWVKENTRLIPYRGMLRGAAGVLMDRAGNSLDRALFLADLLQRAGHTVRIAQKALAGAAVEKLTQDFLAKTPQLNSKTTLSKEALLKLAGDNSGFTKEEISKSIDRLIAANSQYDATVEALGSEIIPAVLKMLEGRSLPKQNVEEIKKGFGEYYWVERRVAAGWEPLVLEDGVIGKESPDATFAHDQVPYNLKHSVNLRLSAEILTGGKLTEKKLLEKNFITADLIGKSVSIGNILMPQPDMNQILKEQNPHQALLQALSDAWIVNPVIQVGTENFQDQLFTFDGRVLPATLQTLAQLGVAGTISVIKVLESFSQILADEGAEKKVQKKDTSIVTAEWLDIEIKDPGRSTRTERRTIFDLLGPAKRSAATGFADLTLDPEMVFARAVSLTGTLDVFIYGATPASSWIDKSVAAGFGQLLEEGARRIEKGEKPETILETGPRERLQLPLWSWALNRSSSTLLPVAFPVASNVVLFWEKIATDDGAADEMKSAVDIVSNSTIINGDFSLRVSQGVLDAIVEHKVFSPGSETGGNTAALFEIDRRANKAWQILDASKAAQIASLNLSGDVKARLTRELESGYLIIVPESPVQTPSEGLETAWWRIDPVSGDTLGISENGMGGAATEEATLLHKIAFKGACALLGIGGQLADGFSFTSSFLMLACLRGPTPNTLFRIGRDTIFGFIIDMFLNAMTPGWSNSEQ